MCYISDLCLPERKFGKPISRREEAKDAGYVKGRKTVRTHDKKIKGWFCFKRQAGDHKNQLATFPGLVASPSSGRRHGKRMTISCIPFTVPTSQEGKTSTRVTCSMSRARRRVPCSAETDKRRGYMLISALLRACRGSQSGHTHHKTGHSAKRRVAGLLAWPRHPPSPLAP